MSGSDETGLRLLSTSQDNFKPHASDSTKCHLSAIPVHSGGLSHTAFSAPYFRLYVSKDYYFSYAKSFFFNPFHSER